MKIILLKYILFFAIILMGNFCNAQIYKYGNVAMGGGGYVSGLITSRIQPNLIFARTDVGGAYRWDATNNIWMPLLDWANTNQLGYMGVEAIAIDPRTASNVYMLVGTSYYNSGATAILRSSDYGATFSTVVVTSQFTAHGNGAGRGNGEKLQVDPNNGNILFCGTRTKGLFKSTDAGLTWARTSLPILTTKNGNGISFVLFDSTSGTAGSATQRMYVGVSTIDSTNNLYTSADGGTTFTPLPITSGPNPKASMPERAVLGSDGNLFVTLDDKEGPGNETSGFIYKYNTTTAAWTNVSPATGIGLGGMSIDPQNPQRIIASSVNTYKPQYTTNSGTNVVYGDRFYLSNNGGTSWTTIVPVSGYGNNNITLSPNGIPWITGQSIHWAGSIEFDPFNNDKAWVTSGNGVFVCNDLNSLSNTNTVNTWNFVTQGIEETVPNDMVSIPNGPFFSVVSDYDGFKQTDITQYSTTGRYSPSTGTTNGIAYAALNTNKLMRVGGSMFYSNDQGVTWTQTSSIGGGGSTGKIALSADGTVILHCPTTNNGGNNTYRSVDNGTSWTICSRININGAVPVADPVNPLKFYAYNSNNGYLLRSTDGGVSFTDSFSVGVTGASKLIRATPGIEGDLWLPLNSSLKHVTTWGTATTVASGVVTFCGSVGLGKAVPPSTYPAIYIWGTKGGQVGVYGSADGGTTWTRLNDDAHQFGGTGNGAFVMGDMNIAGRYYMSTAGRGIAFGDSTTARLLPVTLLSFYGSIINQNQAGLKWQTANESNNSYFDVERSLDGKTFSKVGSVASLAVNGNSSQILGYAYADDLSGLNGLVYYRLKQVDKDGQSTYSNIITLNFGGLAKESAMVFPNPTNNNNNNINLKIQLATDQHIQVSITNILGVLVYKGTPLKLSAGNNLIKLNQTTHFPKGTYVVELMSQTTNTFISRDKLVVQ